MKVPKTSQGDHVPLHIIPGCSSKVCQTITKLTCFCTLLNKHVYEPVELLNDNHSSSLHRDKNYFPTCPHCDDTEALQHFKNEEKDKYEVMNVLHMLAEITL